MKDDEIATKRLSDWKPETDIRLQKAFGKFVEEAGELIAVSSLLDVFKNIGIEDFEDELADSLAFTEIINKIADLNVDYISVDHRLNCPLEKTIADLNKSLGPLLSIVRRCQIQGLDGRHPETGVPNRATLKWCIYHFTVTAKYGINCQRLNATRIMSRKQAKIDSKLPWILGIAIDLKPEEIRLSPQLHPVGTKLRITPTGTVPLSSGYYESFAHVLEWIDDPNRQRDVRLKVFYSDEDSRWFSSSDYQVIKNSTPDVSRGIYNPKPLNRKDHPKGTVVEINPKINLGFDPLTVIINAWNDNLVDQNDVSFHIWKDPENSPWEWCESNDWVVVKVIVVEEIDKMSEEQKVSAEMLDLLATRFCGTRMPDEMCADTCASDITYPHARYGTNLLTVAQSREVFATMFSPKELDALYALQNLT